MSRSTDDTMRGTRWARKPGFRDKQFNDNKCGTLWSMNNHGNRPKVSFKMKNKGNGKKRNIKFGIRGSIDENLVMSVGSNNDVREVAFQQGREQGIRRGWEGSLFHRGGTKSEPHKLWPALNGSDRFPANNPSHGYRITIPFGNKYKKEFVLNSLHNLIAPETFVPIMYKVNHNVAVFYVDDQRISKKILECDRKITTADGSKMVVRVRPGFPRYELDQVLKDKMKDTIAKKYVPEKDAVDLSLFHHNPDLVDDYYCSLTRTPILITALKIVTIAIPNLVEISLDNNQLYSLEKLHLLTKLPCLKILGICNNKIKEMNELNAIMDLKLEELRFAGNPVNEKYIGRQDEYVSDIQKRFPDLLRLDGVVVRAVIGFDLENDRIVLPPAQRLFSVNIKAHEIATEFLQQYFRIFDSENRQPLLDAYDEHARFSMTVSLPHADNKSDTYLLDNRNLCKLVDETRRRKLLKQGRLPVVASISELPRMQHDLNSFTMDIGLVTETMMLVTVTGIFKELESVDQAIRYFSRSFIIMPKGGGYCITNEMFQIMKPTKRQLQESFRSNSLTTAATATAIVAATATATVATATTTTITDDVRAQMTVALRKHTNMTLEWTLKCLNEVQWDYNTALAAFQECHNRGEIPPDAFEK